MLRKWAARFEYHPNDIIALFRAIGYEGWVSLELLNQGRSRPRDPCDARLSSNFSAALGLRLMQLPSRAADARAVAASVQACYGSRQKLGQTTRNL